MKKLCFLLLVAFFTPFLLAQTTLVLDIPNLSSTYQGNANHLNGEALWSYIYTSPTSYHNITLTVCPTDSYANLFPSYITTLKLNINQTGTPVLLTETLVGAYNSTSYCYTGGVSFALSGATSIPVTSVVNPAVFTLLTSNGLVLATLRYNTVQQVATAVHPAVYGLPETTLAPTTAAPTTQAPTTVAPTTVAPTTAAPTTAAPTTQAPTLQPGIFNAGASGEFTPGGYSYSGVIATGGAILLNCQNCSTTNFTFTVTGSLTFNYNVATTNGTCPVYWIVNGAVTVSASTSVTGNVNTTGGGTLVIAAGGSLTGNVSISGTITIGTGSTLTGCIASGSGTATYLTDGQSVCNGVVNEPITTIPPTTIAPTTSAPTTQAPTTAAPTTTSAPTVAPTLPIPAIQLNFSTGSTTVAPTGTSCAGVVNTGSETTATITCAPFTSGAASYTFVFDAIRGHNVLLRANGPNYYDIGGYLGIGRPSGNGLNSAAFTFTAWIQLTVNTSTVVSNVLLAANTLANPDTGLTVIAIPSTASFPPVLEIYNSIPTTKINDSASLWSGVWYHVAFVYNATATPPMIIYKNGVAVASGAAQALITATEHIQLLAQNQAYGLNGMIDFPTIYDVSLSPAQVQLSYTSTPTAYAPTTVAPTTVAPTTTAPTTAAPTTAAPTTAAPTSAPVVLPIPVIRLNFSAASTSGGSTCGITNSGTETNATILCSVAGGNGGVISFQMDSIRGHQVLARTSGGLNTNYGGFIDVTRLAPNTGGVNYQTWTFTSWFQLASGAANSFSNCLLAPQGSATNGPSVYVASGPGQLPVIEVYNVNNAVQSINNANAIVANAWYHMAAVYNATGSQTMVVYQNGVQISNATVTPLTPGTSPIQFLGAFATGQYGLNGLIDEPAIYDVALTAAQVMTKYTNGVPVQTTPAPTITLPTPAIRLNFTDAVNVAGGNCGITNTGSETGANITCFGGTGGGGTGSLAFYWDSVRDHVVVNRMIGTGGNAAAGGYLNLARVGGGGFNYLNYTFTAWVSLTSATPGTYSNVIIGNTAASGAPSLNSPLITATTAYNCIPGTSSVNTAGDTYPLVAGAWYHIAVVYNSTGTPQLSWYHNGVLNATVATETQALLSPTTPISLLAGGAVNSNGYGLYGSLDFPAIYDTALNATVIAAIYANGQW